MTATLQKLKVDIFIMQNYNTSEFYRTYLQSDEWRAKKQARLEIDQGKCQCCGTTENLQCHHFRYDTLGRENVYRDLVTVCDSCHQALHRVMNRRTEKRLDGTWKRGWATVLPFGVRKSLAERGLM